MTSENADERTDASSGGAGAPPKRDEQNRVESDLTREYAGAGIRVQWYAGRCIHSAECIRALPAVFDPRRRPWIDLSRASADAIADAVLRCPTGALHYERTDGGPPETPPEEVAVTVVPNGPYHVRGRVEIRDEQGDLLRRDWRVALCRCGRSGHMPFCDNTHRAIGFRSEPAIPSGGSRGA